MQSNPKQQKQQIYSKNLFKNKIILISGGATGICYQISKHFAQLSAIIYIISRKISNINQSIKQLKQSTNNQNIYGSSCDIRNQKQIQFVVQKIIKQFGTIDILINGAAGNFLCSFEKLTPNAFRNILMIDTVGTFLLSKYVCQMTFKSSGVIINISANLHYNGTILQTHAGTAKAGVDALTKHMAVELGPRNIRVVGICPGIIGNTEGYSKLAMKKSQHDNQIYQIIPLQRIGQSKNIAQCACFLASNAASYITGITVVVDGGHTLTSANFPFFSSNFVKQYSNKQPSSKL